jgi:hypothetical protein
MSQDSTIKPRFDEPFSALKPFSVLKAINLSHHLTLDMAKQDRVTQSHHKNGIVFITAFDHQAFQGVLRFR